jgi:hypothetical protein
MLILNRELADRLRTGLLLKDLERAVEPERGVGRRRDREPEIELVGAEVVVRDARVRIDDPGGALRVLGVHLRRDQHRRVPQRAGVEDRRDLANDPLVQQPLGAAQRLLHSEPRAGRDGREGLGVEREARLEQVHEPLVVVVERNRRAAAAGADLRSRLPEWRVRAAQSQPPAAIA